MALRKLYSTKKVLFNALRLPKLPPKRSLSVSISRFEEAKAIATKVDIKPEWERALVEAEKCVGHQPSFLSLRYLMNDEVANWNGHMEKLEFSEHPMYNAAR